MAAVHRANESQSSLGRRLSFLRKQDAVLIRN